jgi:hypothetical protein
MFRVGEWEETRMGAFRGNVRDVVGGNPGCGADLLKISWRRHRRMFYE